MRLHSKAVAILIMFLFLMASVVPMINGNMVLYEPTPPVTSIFFDSDTGIITLVAVDYPLNTGSGVNATYYKIDGGPQIVYTEPFKITDGTHTIQYWSVDNVGFVEDRKSVTYTVDTTPPTVEITSPETGGIYFQGEKIFELGDKTVCIGKVPIKVDAYDKHAGVYMVFFKIMNDTGFDTTPPYEYTCKGAHFGELTITVTAMDKKGLMSEPETMTINVYSLGIL